jgi:Helicase conserved C-terminal domain
VLLVPQQRRRAEILRFKNDASCRMFLSTDSGSVGLNLQVASAVVNVDLPWNPARLEQRIARSWRKNQTRSVTVVNLVCENSIEHGILHLLGQKQALAEGVLDGCGDIDALKLPSGRAAMVEHMQAMLTAADATAPRIVTADEAIAEELRDISLRLPAAAMTEPLRGLRRGEHVADRGLLLMCLALLLLAAWNVWQILQYNVPA